MMRPYNGHSITVIIDKHEASIDTKKPEYEIIFEKNHPEKCILRVMAQCENLTSIRRGLIGT